MAGDERQRGQQGQGQGRGGEPETLHMSGTNEFTVEVVHWRNNPLKFSPTQSVMRARFLKSNLKGDEYVELIESLPDNIPGQRITINIRERRAKVFDPLELDENREMWVKLQTIHKEKLRQTIGPMPGGDYKGPSMTETDLKTWLHEIRHLLDSPQFKDGSGNMAGGPMMIEVAGTCPRMEDIMKLPGDIRCNFHSNSSTLARVRGKVAEPVA